MEQHGLASSILQPLALEPNTTTSTASVARQKRARDSYLYDRNGKRLKGLKGEAAKLMHNHRFFSSEEEIHHLEQTLAVGQRSMEPLVDSSGVWDGGAGIQKLPALPDMFGVVPPTAATGGGTADAANGEDVAPGAVVPAMHRWSLVRRRLATVGLQSGGMAGSCAASSPRLPRVSNSGYRWERADSLLVENALMSAALAEKEEDGENDGNGGCGGDCSCRRGDLPGSWLAAQHLSVPPEVELTVLHTSAEPSPCAFFTVSAEEYAVMGLDNDEYQPTLLSHEGKDSDAVHWRFDFSSTCRLLSLYERFGNFVVVADRWRYTDARDVVAAPASPSGFRAAATDTTEAGPPVEVLMERYRLVSEAVLRHRLHLLQETLKEEEDRKDGEDAVRSSPSRLKLSQRVVSVKPTEERAPTSIHPLTSLMEKHPVLVAQRRRQEWLAQRYQELCESNGTESAPQEAETGETRMLARHRAEVLQQCMESFATSSALPLASQQQLSQAACKRNGDGADVSLLLMSSPPPPASPFWYDGLLEQLRRRRLREFLTHEATMNVPYFRALMAEQRVSSQATVLFDKLRVLTNETATDVQQDEQICPVDVGKFVGRRAPRSRRQGVGKARNQPQQQQSALDGMGEDSYQGVQVEVSRVPLQCERLRLCVQAGWFLPPPDVGANGKPTGGGSTVANRALSNFGEALLLSLPPTVPRLHLGVELELEKHLWEDHRALCDDNADVQQLLCEARVLYTQNVILRRFAGKCGVLEAALRKLASEAATEM
ncbi:hypothetical protein TraAM80_08229 [Trypanosoma rangeli]|uniref:Uncharacterized protein n=1 Tax=Trypanosoma rangeli TaxID=5698 RepID=A0A3R7KFB5_TRYRA|nr:uncharacterized protein TraAM80_08229 [Trypanosoma rangeli]RNE99362.1 hypothetical protein TraAM80_08229 [Trypanosoma rangeli]|eukprot:RNE99362.1 hypothetical protein TraAM80_08229 [Trypanosoma rangeli]